MLKKTAVFLTTLGLASFSCLPHASAAGEVYLPNLGLNATGTIFGLKRGLDVNIVAPAPEGATAAPGALPPALDKIIGGLGLDGFIHTVATDNSGNLLTQRTWTLSDVTDSVASSQKGAWTAGRTWTLGSVADSVSAVQSGSWSLLNITGTISLPTGASTAANQSTEITSLSSIDTKLTSQATAANQATGNTSLSSIDGKVSTSANQSTEITSLSSIDGKLTGVSTAANQVTGNTSLASVDTKLSSQATAANQSTEITSLASIDTKLTSQATAANQTTGNTSLASIDGKVATEVTASAINAKLANNFGAVAGAVRTAAQLGNATGTADFGSGTTSSQTLRVVIPTDQAPVQVKAPVNSTGSGASGTVSTVTTLTAPANATGFILQNLDTSTTNIRWAVGRAATATVGQQLQPGRDSGFVPLGANVSIISESGTNDFDIQWVSQ